MRKAKRTLALVFTLLLLTGSSGFALELSPVGELPLTAEAVTLTIGVSPSPLTTDYKTNAWTKLVERETGVNLEFVMLPADSYEAAQKFALMVSAGQKLPDIICLGNMSDVMNMAYGSSGVFLPLNEYLESDAHYWNQAMDKHATPEQKANLLKYAMSPDGNIYGFPSYNIAAPDSTSLGLYMNKTWLDNLGLEIPTTTQELYDVLVAFRDLDANGNGDMNDEIPLIGHKSWMGSVPQLLMNSFVYDAFNPFFNYQLSAEDGVLYAPFITDAYREGLRYISNLCKEGLLSPLSFSMTIDELRAINCIPNDQSALVGAFVSHPVQVFAPDGSVDRMREYVGLPAMIGPEGVQWTPTTGELGYYGVHITRDCQDPELAFRVLDAMCREDISLSWRFGEQGVDWEYVTEGKTAFAFLDTKPIFTLLKDDPFVSENNRVWHSQCVGVMPAKLNAGQTYDPDLEEGNYLKYKLFLPSVELRYWNHPEETVIKVIFTQEELDAIGEIETAVRAYVDESLARFILGDLDVEKDWNSYISSLDSMGLQRYLETAQKAYDRMNAK